MTNTTTYQVVLTPRGEKYFDALVQSIDDESINMTAEQDRDIMTPLGIVHGEMGHAVYVQDKTMEAIIEEIRAIQEEEEFDLTDGSELKEEWFDFREIVK